MGWFHYDRFSRTGEMAQFTLSEGRCIWGLIEIFYVK
jgi:hypothetical protein